MLGGKGRVEGCQVWGNAQAGVGIRGDGSEAVVVGCKCAGKRRRAFSSRLCISDSAGRKALLPTRLTLRGRIRDGNNVGVAFILCGKGLVEDCKVWGHELANVAVQDSGSQASVKGCECADA